MAEAEEEVAAGSAGRALAGAGLGLVTLGAQVLLVRELWTAVWGSEALAGMAVAVWLAAAGLGSFLAGRAARSSPGARACYPAVLIALALALPGAILLLRWLPDPLIVPGVGPSIFYAALTLGHAGLLGGALFPLTLRAVFGERGGSSAAVLYRWDMVGSVLGGGLLTVAVLACGLGTLRTALLVSCAALALACWFLARRRASLAALPGVLALCGCAAAFAGLDRATLQWRYRAEEVVGVSETAAGRTVLTSREGQRCVYISGRFAGSGAAPERSEALAAIAAGECARPRRALLLGSALADVAPRLAEHGAAVTAIVPERLVAESREGVEYGLGDGRAALRSGDEKYDLVVVDAGAPATFAGARLLTAECFASARRRLTPEGILAVALPAGVEHLTRPQARVAGGVWSALGEAFPRRRLWALPEVGLVMIGFAADARPASRAEVAERVAARKLPLIALAPERLADRMMAQYVSTRLLPEIESAPRRPNRDAHMRAVLDQMAADRVRLSGGASEGFEMPPEGIWLVLGAGCALGLVLGIAGLVRRGGAPGAAAFGAGMVGAGLEIVALIGYQVARGSLYAEVGLLLAAFMAGGALGAELLRRRPISRRTPAIGLVLLAAVAGSSSALAAAGVEGLAGGLLWLLLMLLAGAAVGATFAAAAAHPAEPRPGTVYALDLAGAAAGGLLAVVAVPWAGLIPCAFAAAICAGLCTLGTLVRLRRT
jgi:predicted membrane-bound spermidine synthase